jgi:hypothetical protein
MTILAASNRPSKRFKRLGSIAALGLLALTLSGCIQPDAVYNENGPSVGAGTLIFPPTFTPDPSQPLPTQPIFAPEPTIPGAVAAPTPEPAVFIWGSFAVGPEQVAIMFYLNPTGQRCVRYIFRSKVVERCPQPGQTLATVTGQETAADNRRYTIVAGRALDTRIKTVTIEFQDGSSQPLQVTRGGYLVILDGARPVRNAVPIDENGNLVGGVVPVV